MTTMSKIACEFKFVKLFGNGEEGYGFFSLAALRLSDAHFEASLMRQFGFEPNYFVGRFNLPAVIDFQSDADGKLHAIKIHSIGGQAAGEPIVSTPVTPESEFFRKPKVGDIVVCRFDNGFAGGTNAANYGFFAPTEVDIGNNIFVYRDNISLSMLALIGRPDIKFEVMITDINDRGFVGKVMGQHKSVKQIAPTSVVNTKEDKRQAREARRAVLLARESLQVTNVAEQKLHGLPVTEEEWPSLPAGTYAVLVDSFDLETGEAVNPIEVFRVEKPGGKPTKVDVKTDVFYPESVTAEIEAKGNEPFVPVDTALCVVESGGANVPVPCFAETSKARADKLVGLLRAKKLKVDNQVVEYIVLEVGGKYALISSQWKSKMIEKPQLLSALQAA